MHQSLYKTSTTFIMPLLLHLGITSLSEIMKSEMTYPGIQNKRHSNQHFIQSSYILISDKTDGMLKIFYAETFSYGDSFYRNQSVLGSQRP